MPKLKKEQRLVFIITDDGKGNMEVTCDFFPRIAETPEKVAKLSPNMRQIQAMAGAIAKSIMDGLGRGIVEEEAVSEEAQPEALHDAAGLPQSEGEA